MKEKKKRKSLKIPDKATRSSIESPFLRKMSLMTLKLEKAVGILREASKADDIVPSLLPVGTSHKGLPYYEYHTSTV